ncbi:forkhead box protein G1-like [Platysternon megacephalum]|uniref:Forkhead box protein G1-like n=1 Tax=Platysternon megacephalum TaxID=55544 RepID=A0A4D9DXL8_9SAUR|nr:forkhead box protein G1-like [Platysternon megacephalum]
MAMIHQGAYTGNWNPPTPISGARAIDPLRVAVVDPFIKANQVNTSLSRPEPTRLTMFALRCGNSCLRNVAARTHQFMGANEQSTMTTLRISPLRKPAARED